MKKIYLFCLLLASSLLPAQYAPFTPLPANLKSEPGNVRKVQPLQAAYFEIGNPNELARFLQKADAHDDLGKSQGVLLDLPAPNGDIATFRLFRYQMIRPGLQAKYPSFVTLYGWDVDNPGRRVHLDWTELGFGAMITGGKEGRWSISPLNWQETDRYQSYFAADFPQRIDGSDHCDFTPDERVLEELRYHMDTKAVGDCELREYDLALACTGEYYAAVGGTEALVVSEMMAAINRVNQFYRADLALTLTIINLPVAGGDVELVYSNPMSDPYTNESGSAMLAENQTTIDAVIGSANYDIGHVFSTGGGGIASLEAPCDNSIKAHGVTGLPNPTGDPFYIDFVAHEMGHQFGGTHTFNSTEVNCSQRTASTACEPGGGTTIQAYAGICGPIANIQLNSDPYYHAASIRQIATYMELGNGSNCAVTSSTVNAPPSGNAGNDYTIPANTPFVLTAVTSTDANGDAITYCWEQFDLGAVAAGTPTGNETDGPLFRSFPPAAELERYFPNLASLAAGSATEWEVLPRVARDMTFILTVRDFGSAGYGCPVQDETDLTVVASSGYTVTFPNGGESVLGGSVATVTWDVASTGAGTAVNCTMADIMLSRDGGRTYPTLLATVPNNGSADVQFPAITETEARIMIRGNGNIFFDISDNDFRIEQTDFALTTSVTSAAACAGADEAGIYSFNLESLQGYAGTVNYSISGAPAGVLATFTPASTTLGSGTQQEVTFSLSGLSGTPPGSVTFELSVTDGVSTKTDDFTVVIKSPLAAPTLITPADNGFLDPAASAFDWSDVPEASEYFIQIFLNTSGTGGSLVTTVTQSEVNFGGSLSGNLNEGEMYSWRITARDNDCSPVAQAVSDLFVFTYGTAPPIGNSLSTTNGSPTICEGRIIEEEILINFFDGDLRGPADLTVTAVPQGLSVSLSPTTLNANESSTVSITGENSLTPGSYTITIRADDGAMTEDINVVLEVLEDGVPLTSPVDGGQVMINSDGSGTIPLSFDAVPGQTGYTANIKFDNGSGASLSVGPGTTNINVGPVNDGAVTTISVDGNNGAVGCDYTFTFLTTLPVEWLNFQAIAVDKVAQLDWTVEQDDAHAGFTIQRTLSPGATWSDLAYVSGSGLPGTESYRYQDLSVSPGSTYQYRLRQEDADGRTDYSPIRTVRFAAQQTSLYAYPNPVSGKLNLGAAAGAAEGLKYQVLTVLGQEVRTGEMTNGTAVVDLADLANGIYQVVVSNGEAYRQTIRIVKR